MDNCVFSLGRALSQLASLEVFCNLQADLGFSMRLNGANKLAPPHWENLRAMSLYNVDPTPKLWKWWCGMSNLETLILQCCLQLTDVDEHWREAQQAPGSRSRVRSSKRLQIVVVIFEEENPQWSWVGEEGWLSTDGMLQVTQVKVPGRYTSRVDRFRCKKFIGDQFSSGEEMIRN